MPCIVHHSLLIVDGSLTNSGILGPETNENCGSEPSRAAIEPGKAKLPFPHFLLVREFFEDRVDGLLNCASAGRTLSAVLVQGL